MSQEKIERWNEVDGNLDNGEKLQAFLDSTTDAYAILQLRRTDERMMLLPLNSWALIGCL